LEDKRGFTIVELLVVIIIISILAIIGGGAYLSGIEKAREGAAISSLRLLHVTLEMYAVDSKGRYPVATSLDELYSSLKDYLLNKKMPDNPYNNQPYSDENNDHYQITYTYDSLENVYTLTIWNRYNIKRLLLLSNKIVIKEE